MQIRGEANQPELTRLQADLDSGLGIQDAADGKITTLAKLPGGLGPLDPPGWSPDGKRLVFISYQMLP